MCLTHVVYFAISNTFSTNLHKKSYLSELVLMSTRMIKAIHHILIVV